MGSEGEGSPCRERATSPLKKTYKTCASTKWWDMTYRSQGQVMRSHLICGGQKGEVEGREGMEIKREISGREGQHL